MPSAKHMQAINANPSISGAIFSTQRLPSGDVIGIQFTGIAYILTSREEVELAAKYHYSRSQPKIDYLTR